ncbi:hypothetical protein [Nocardioides donggukensis]|uniref:Uncharacterized protein n=1 Tax=Nocardioides donggukensis TaxID=2774019 RepID=A0A927K6L6_9ACTN|nr:hypothetical protein [Nocardioides donggukensis]MBD8871159.1 hypothetical protein [Nocardioides donggukensis]
MCGKCKDEHSDGAREARAVGAASADNSRPIKATIQPGFHSEVSIRIVPGRDFFKEPQREECAPRGDRPFVVRPMPLPTGLVDKLTEANTAVISWLAKDQANAQQFIDDPVAALERAGVELSRAEAKMLSRSNGALREDAVLPPGTSISKLTVSATKRGKVGDARPSKPSQDTSDDQGSGAAGDPDC